MLDIVRGGGKILRQNKILLVMAQFPRRKAAGY